MMNTLFIEFRIWKENDDLVKWIFCSGQKYESKN